MLAQNKKKWLRYACICLILVVCIGFSEIVRTIGYAENSIVYVEDVRVITSEKGKTEDAKSWCNENGYVFTGIDLNEKSDTKKNAYLCYKTTDVKEKAITELRVLAMDEGYSLYDYDQMVQQLKSQNSGTAQTMYNTAQEFIEKYNQGSPRAQDAYLGLNLFYVSDDGNQKLGDYILSGKADKTFFVKMIVQCSAFAVSMTLSLLNIGIAAYENDLDEETQTTYTSNWGEMLEKSNLASMIEDNQLSTDEMSELDQEYNDISRDLFKQIQDFTTSYENAKTNYESHGYTVDEDAVSNTREKSSEANTSSDESETSTETTTKTTTTTTTEDSTEESTEASSEDASETTAESTTETTTEAITTTTTTEASTTSTTKAKSETTTEKNDNDEEVNNVVSSIREEFEQKKQEYLEYDKDAAQEEASGETEEEEEYDSDSDTYYIASYLALNDYYYDDDTKLGDWILETGHKTSDEVDYQDLYPLVEAMGTVQANIVSLTGITSATYNLQKNESNEEYKSMVEELKEVIKHYNGNDNDSFDIWEAAEADYEGAQLAFTNDKIRKTQASNSLGVTSEKEKFEKDFSLFMECFGIVMSVISIVAAYLKLAAFVVSCSWAGTFVAASTVSFITSLAAGVSTFMAGLSAVILIVLIIIIIVFAIIILCYEENKSDYHSEYPNYVFDAVDKDKNTVATIKYQSVRGTSDNPNDDPTDINCKKQYKWVILEQTKDPYVGSPIVVTKDSNGNDITFRSFKDDGSFQDGYDCAKYFGNRNAADLNAYCDDPDAKLYLHYTTEESTGKATPADIETEEAEDEEDDEEKNYIGDLIVSIGKDDSEARAGITSHSGKFYVFDYNFSPDQEFATYIGYSITTDKEKAFTDLRVAPYQGNDSDSSSITYGDISYTRINTLGYYTDPGEKGSSTTSDALYYTKDTNAGSPILADGLKGVSDPSKLYDDGLQPVTFFGNDVAYNFNTVYDNYKGDMESYSVDEGGASNYVTAYKQKDSRKDDYPWYTGAYLCYEPETKYTEGTKYLSGFFFCGGYDVKGNDEVSDFTEKLQEDSHLSLQSNVNLAKSINSLTGKSDILGTTDESNLQNYIGYTWSYNPNRAITHAYIYQGDSYSQYSTKVNYAVSKANVNTDASVGYVAATYLNQGIDSTGREMLRYIDQSNCFRFFTGMAMHCNISGIAEEVSGSKKYAKDLPNDIAFGWEKHYFLPTALYVGGHQNGVSGLTLDDCVITETKADGTNVELSGEKTLGGNNASDSFYPVVDMKNPHETEPFNLGYPDYYKTEEEYNKDSDKWEDVEKLIGSNQPYYIYLKGAREDKRTYISSLTIGAYSRDQYEESNTIDEDDRDDTLKEVDKVINATAMATAASGGTDEMLVYNFGVDGKGQSKAWYNYADENGKASRSAPEDVRAAYIGVTRTSSENDAIRGVLLYRTDESTAGNELTYNSVKYTCAGNTCPIYMNGEKYYLYYTKNTGVSPGEPIEDIKIDNTPIISGYATNLCGDDNHSEPYGNPDQTFFIHLKYTPDSGDFFNKLYIATGATSRKAQCELLSQGCNEFIDLDMNNGVQGETMLLGFRRGSIDWATINKKSSDEKKQKEYNKQTQEAIYDIIVTNGEEYHKDGFVCRNIFYYPVTSKNLNSDTGKELYMYVATPWYSSRYNSNNNANTQLPQDEYTGYYTSLAFAQGDRVPYNTSVQSEGGNSKIPWEYIMESNNVDHADLNKGEVKFNGTYAEDCRVTMFGQRSDGSVKPAGEITGGFLEAQYAVGDMVSKIL